MQGIAFTSGVVLLVLISAILWRKLQTRRCAQSHARENSSLFQATFEQAAVGIAHLSPDGRWLRVNDTICQIAGYSRDELMQLTFQDITHAEDMDANLAYVKQMLSGEISTFSMDKRYLHKLGAIVRVRLTASLTRKSDGQPDYFISVIEDITRDKLACAQLSKLKLQADALMEQQVVVQTVLALAHELNQPLNAAGSYSEAAVRLIKADELNREKLLEVIKYSVTEIQRAGNVMRNLIHNVHQAGPAIETFELICALNEAIEMFQAERYENNAIEFASEPKALQVRANRLGLEKVLMNLLLNAYQASDQSACLKIALRVEQCQDSVIVSVIDNGPSIASPIVGKLFDPFFTTKPNGVGMGLSISRALIEGGGGKLWYEPVDGQTAFHFSIRMAEPPGQSRERRIKYQDRRRENRRSRLERVASGAWTAANGERRKC